MTLTWTGSTLYRVFQLKNWFLKSAHVTWILNFGPGRWSGCVSQLSAAKWWVELVFYSNIQCYLSYLQKLTKSYITWPIIINQSHTSSAKHQLLNWNPLYTFIGNCSDRIRLCQNAVARGYSSSRNYSLLHSSDFSWWLCPFSAGLILWQAFY